MGASGGAPVHQRVTDGATSELVRLVVGPVLERDDPLCGSRLRPPGGEDLRLDPYGVSVKQWRRKLHPNESM